MMADPVRLRRAGAGSAAGADAGRRGGVRGVVGGAGDVEPSSSKKLRHAGPLRPGIRIL